ncbi:RNA polymerase sigma factor [Clostridium sporogenes]|uniref:sigma-70 family RNA polymerase sigma factor n=1 Tax=Clostridium botulinum TaxID=1491 RepID=UPI0007177FE8|nr:sigma-70 family RNA polymerase sigma factor [Clostridium botulinum]KRU25950.1 RNA polymerase sigma factor [Clostridium sporogenes]KRU32631.1 RNA polymerase sigma factor [Clostridium sporogenes]KRU34463.1 RNA polymerase sigma factor [Clostridium sporogenes]KRU39983.1 RNA polymerase sigma factor [Clostridium sporogenes]MBZ1331145.1 sigma-70 family RNA polymerase sigma factor [Clostridium botulinum]
MNYEQIENQVGLAKKGENEAIITILNTFKPFILKMVKEFNCSSNDFYDLLQICYIALIRAIDKYRLGSNVFKSYAYSVIKNEFRRFTRDNKKHKELKSLNETNENTNREAIESVKDSYNLEESFIDQEENEKLKKVLAKLPEDEFELIFLVYYNGLFLKTYAQKKGMTYAMAVYKKNKILEKIKNEYNKIS